MSWLVVLANSFACLRCSSLQSREPSASLRLPERKGKTRVSSHEQQTRLRSAPTAHIFPPFFRHHCWPAVRDWPGWPACVFLWVFMWMCISSVKPVVGVWVCRMWHTSCCKAGAKICSDCNLKITLSKQQNSGVSWTPDLRDMKPTCRPHQWCLIGCIYIL